MRFLNTYLTTKQAVKLPKLISMLERKINYQYSKDYTKLYETLYNTRIKHGAVFIGFLTLDSDCLDDDMFTNILYLHKSNIKKILGFYGFDIIPLISFVNYCTKLNLRFIPI